ncbi:serine hydrolase domain-containing protein [Deinococcus cellulosilyticus]|uniref:Serine hydrolase n=1 Tax=Deinococcus cellulosilyticus (strain DSM 18568 / NBRC 106333 / KACC 11606 / 5516J-15) TaxID=1223518 RepID=A0A511N2V7_DEIC1|nr:serine hydrolase domain-containing protein [Deinococcus cellulosilyticus]GEM46788.1 serine hydrolase [Deinococcus cellulosilyticus NBRC 106333 = KACC 11606]
MAFADPGKLKRLEQFRLEQGVPGISLAVVRNGKPELVTTVGHPDLQGEHPLALDALFPIYSVTKTLIAAALMLLMRDHPLQLDDAVAVHLPDLHLPETITIRHLLNHTGGLPDYGSLKAYQEALRAHPPEPWTEKEYLTLISSMGLQQEAGDTFLYSNVGYLVLKLLVEKLSGKRLAETLKQLLFDPMGLQNTRVAENLQDMADLTPGFSRFWSPELQDVREFYHPGWVAHGVVLSTASELAALVDTLFTSRVLLPRELGEMMQAVVVADHHPIFTVPGYGLGLMIDALRHEFIGHGGGGPGYSIGALHCPDRFGESFTCVVMVNQEGGWGLELAHQVILEYSVHSSQ